jgi:hypothetical protein
MQIDAIFIPQCVADFRMIRLFILRKYDKRYEIALDASGQPNKHLSSRLRWHGF